jgi:hypothetical protein
MKPVKGGQGPVWAVAPLIIIIIYTYGQEKEIQNKSSQITWAHAVQLCEIHEHTNKFGQVNLIQNMPEQKRK